jgi:hypothetical protein
MSARELAGWIAYFECIEPLPDPTRDAALICWVIAMVNRSKGPAPRIEDFMPRPPAAERRGQSTEEMLAAFGRAAE